MTETLARAAARIDRLRAALADVRVRVERNRFDWLVGVRCRRWTSRVESERWRRGRTPAGQCCVVGQTVYVERDRIDLWLCVIPGLALRASWAGRVRERMPRWRGSEANEVAGAAAECRPALTAAMTS